MSPRKGNREKERNDKSKALKKELSRYVTKNPVARNDSKVKKGLFQKGLCTNHLKRTKVPLDVGKNARLNGDLSKIISLVNGKQPSVICDNDRPSNKNFSHSRHQTSEFDSSPTEDREKFCSPLPNSVQNWESPKDFERHSNDLEGKKQKPPPARKDAQVPSHKFESFLNTGDVKKARTADFVNSLPSIFDDNTKPKLSAQNSKNEQANKSEEFKHAHMIYCYNEHVSAVNNVLLNIKKNRFQDIDYNQALKDAIVRDYSESCENSSSTSVNETASGTLKSSIPAKHVHFKNSKYSPNLEMAPKFSPSIYVPSPPHLSPPLVGSPFFGKTSFLNNSQASSLPLNSQPFNSQPPQGKTSFLNSSHASSLPLNSQSFNSQALDSQPLTYDFLAPPAPQFHPTLMHSSQNSMNFYDLNHENPYSLNQQEKLAFQEPHQPLDLDPSSAPFSFTPQFKFYPRNMF